MGLLYLLLFSYTWRVNWTGKRECLKQFEKIINSLFAVLKNRKSSRHVGVDGPITLT